MRTVFVDGSAGTTGLRIVQRLAARADLVLLTLPEPLRKDNTYRYKHTVLDLLRALDLIAERNQRQLPPPIANFKGIVAKEPYPVTKKAGEVLRQLLLRGVERLKNMFRGNRSRSEIVATFLAILELCKTNSVALEDDISGENPNIRLLKTDAPSQEVH